MADVTINANVVDGAITSPNITFSTPVTAQVVTGAKGDKGDTGATGSQGATGGIVPITVSSTAPTSPGVNDLWIDIS